ncbi:MAG: hypothetical protein ABIQ01_04530 [Pseudolysinimonas sp.]
MRRVLPWIVAFVLAIAAGGGAVAALNATVFGPGDFVRVYLDAVARGDAQSALDLPGVDAAGAEDALLDDRVLTGLTGIRQLSDDDLGGARHRVTFAWTSPGGHGTTAFEVERVGTRLGLFPEWGFSESPVARIVLDVRHDPRFTANGVQLATAREGEGVAGPVEYAVLVPGSYVFGHDSTFLQARDVTVLADEVGAVPDAVVDVQAGPALASTIDEEVRAHLDDCTTQQVLFPTGCPFGKTITNRVVSDPVWTMLAYPVLEVEPGAVFGTWVTPPASGTAHLVVEVKSLFEGTVSTFDEDVVFEVSYTVSVDGENLTVSEVD